MHPVRVSREAFCGTLQSMRVAVRLRHHMDDEEEHHSHLLLADWTSGYSIMVATLQEGAER